MAPHHHRPCVIGLRDVFLVFQNTVDPATDRNTGHIHHRNVVLTFVGIGGLREAAFQPIQIFLPDACPVGPRTCCKAIVAGQGIGQNAKVGCALYVVVTTEDVCATTGCTHVAKCQLQHTVSACVVVAVGVLGTTHTPDHGAGTVVGQRTRNPLKLRARRAGDALDLFGVPLGDFFLDLVHAPHAGADELFVFPAVFKDVPQDAPDQGNVRTRTEADIFVGVGCGARETRVADDQRRVVLFLGLQHVKQGNRVRLGGVATDDKDRTAVVDVVVRVCHGAVAPCVRNARNRGRVTDTRLVIDVVRTPISGELAIQVGLFVVRFRRTQPIDRVRAAFIADRQHLVADFVDGVFPRHTDPFAVFFLHGILQAAFSVCVFTHRRTFGAVCAKVERAVPAGLLPDPNAVRHFGHNSTADRTMGTNRLYRLNRAVHGLLSAGLCNRTCGGADGGKTANRQT